MVVEGTLNMSLSPEGGAATVRTTHVPYEFSWILSFNHDPMNVFVVMFFILALVMGTLINLLTAIMAFRYRNNITFKVSVEMLSLLAFTDTIFCASQGIQTTKYFITGQPLTRKCQILSSVGVICLMLEQTLYIWIIFERIHSILRPITHRNQCKFRRTQLDILKILFISSFVSGVLLFTSDKLFDIYRGRCWVRSLNNVYMATFGIYSLLPVVSSVLLLLLILYLVYSAKYTTHNSRKALVNLSAFAFVYLLSSYSEFVIIALRVTRQRRYVRYFLMADSIISLMSRCVSPLVMINFIAGFNIFCISGLENRVISLLVKIRITSYHMRIKMIRYLQYFASCFHSNNNYSSSSRMTRERTEGNLIYRLMRRDQDHVEQQTPYKISDVLHL